MAISSIYLFETADTHRTASTVPNKERLGPCILTVNIIIVPDHRKA
jgi:hypothetical protein